MITKVRIPLKALLVMLDQAGRTISTNFLRRLITALEEHPGAAVIIAPNWDLLSETLEMDAESSAFDPALRADIRRALDALVVVEEE
jgi:hypothetical protein